MGEYSKTAMDYVASKAYVAKSSWIEEKAIFSFPFCLFVIFVVVVVIVVLRLRRVGACFGGALGVNHRSAREKKRNIRIKMKEAHI